MKVLVIRKKVCSIIGLGILFCFGVWLSQISPLQKVMGHPQKQVAIVIDDFGGQFPGIGEMMALPHPLTFAVMPFQEFSRQQAEEAYAKGFEIIVHMPFEAFAADRRWYGRQYISSASTLGEIRRIIEESFQILPMAVGLSNHMGSKATAEPKIMKEVFKELQRVNRFYFDSRTTPAASPATTIARNLNLPFAKRDIFLDNVNSTSHMRKQLKKLMDLATVQGFAVGIGHVGPTGKTLAEVLRQELPKYEKEGFQLVPLSKLIYTRVHGSQADSGMVIGIDPGHGGIDSGTRWGNLLEKDLNLKFSRKLAAALDERGYQVMMTRDEDRLLTSYAHFSYKNCPYKLDDFRCRIQKLETAGARAIISVHVNWNRLSFHRGPVVYFSAGSPVSQKIAEHIQGRLNQVQPFRKIPRAGDFYFLKHTRVPTVLLELGFLSNAADRRLLRDETYLEKLASAVVNGLTDTF